MKNLATKCLIVMMLCGSVLLQAQGWEWARKIGGTQLDEIERVCVDQEGNVVVAGKFSGSFMYEGNPMNSSGSKNIFVSKYTSDGTLLWVRTAGGTGLDESLCIGTDKDNNVLISGFFTGLAVFDSIIVQGHASDEVFVAKYDPLGNLLWVRTAGGPGNDRGKGIDADSKGNVLVTGYYYDTCNFGATTLVSPGLDNIFVAKYAPDGTFLWAADAGGIYSAWASSISTDAFDNAYITGSFKETALFGNHSITTYGGNDVFLARVDSSGSWTLAVHGGGTADDYGNGIEVGINNHIAVTGSFFQTVLFGPSASITTNGDKDGFIAYYDPQGNCLWARNMGGTSSDKGIDASIDKDENIYVVGHIYGSALFDTILLVGNGSDEVFLAKYDPLGELQYALLAGGTSADFGKGMQVDKQGVSYAGGFFQGTATFGSHSLVSAGDRDAFVAKFYDGSPLVNLLPYTPELCAGTTLSLGVQVNGPGPFNYLWFDDAGSILGAVYPTFTIQCHDPSYSGKYYCIVGNAMGSVTSDTAYISVHPLPIVEIVAPDTLYSHDTLVITAGSGFATYLWSTGETMESIVLYPQVLGTGWKEFSVTVTDAHGCQAADTILILIVDVGIVEPLQEYDVSLFPNPASNQVYLHSPFASIEKILIHNLSGQCMYNHAGWQKQSEILLDISALPQGIYFVQIYTHHSIVNYKLMIYRK